MFWWSLGRVSTKIRVKSRTNHRPEVRHDFEQCCSERATEGQRNTSFRPRFSQPYYLIEKTSSRKWQTLFMEAIIGLSYSKCSCLACLHASDEPWPGGIRVATYIQQNLKQRCTLNSLFLLLLATVSGARTSRR